MTKRSWGRSWDKSWGKSWGATVAPTITGGGGKLRRRQRSFGDENSLSPDDTRKRKIAKANAALMVVLH